MNTEEYPQDCTMNTDRCEKLKMLVRVARSAVCHDTPVHIYRLFEVESSIFGKVTVSVVLSKKTSYGQCLVVNGYREGAVWIYRPNFVISFFLWGWMKTGVCRRKVDTADELLARILDAAGCIKKREDQLRRTARDLRTRVAKCSEAGDGTVERLFWTVKKSII